MEDPECVEGQSEESSVVDIGYGLHLPGVGFFRWVLRRGWYVLIYVSKKITYQTQSLVLCCLHRFMCHPLKVDLEKVVQVFTPEAIQLFRD